MPSPELPFGACVLSALAGALIALEGIVLLGIPSVVRGRGLFVPLPAAGAEGAAVVAGVVVIVLAFVLLFRPAYHVGMGLGITVAAIGSLVAGGGFLLGTALGVVGGLFALAFRPVAAPPPQPEVPSEPDEPFDDPVIEADRADQGDLGDQAEAASAPGPSSEPTELEPLDPDEPFDDPVIEADRAETERPPDARARPTPEADEDP